MNKGDEALLKKKKHKIVKSQKPKTNIKRTKNKKQEKPRKEMKDRTPA